MEIELLGSLSLQHNGRRFGVGSRKVRSVLALLALSPGSALSFDQITDELWADKSMSNVRNALQANIARLRKLLETITGQGGEELVRTVSSGYLLDVPAESVDTHRFLSLARHGAGLAESRPHDAIGVLREALLLWRGPALLDVAEGTRCRAAATHLDERRLTVQEDLIGARLAVGEERGVVHELKQLVVENPGRERLSEYLMLALYRSGRQSEAVSVFHRTRNWLRAELGLEPGRALRQLYQAILVQDRVLD
ncbi:AfsR/SARP family transcriptional regulator [Amycolatopsis anabasis]|uniref:AfsR/SARP family transcriptional regulator n=1 Tax=Amycolatopsis anabasis TaxID=1840409 RepID=UPI00131B57C0|nr:AfsR/SARP family transcriptional regulator [Amycolatopsis anabasis]